MIIYKNVYIKKSFVKIRKNKFRKISKFCPTLVLKILRKKGNNSKIGNQIFLKKNDFFFQDQKYFLAPPKNQMVSPFSYSISTQNFSCNRKKLKCEANRTCHYRALVLWLIYDCKNLRLYYVMGGARKYFWSWKKKSFFF
jgi:hypothetical protein